MRHELHEPTINALVGTFLREVKAGTAGFTIPMTHLDDWDVQELHASDLGTCPRKIAHRLQGDERVEKTFVQLDNDARQFYVANVVHHLLYNALQWDERLIDFEVDLTPWMPDGFAGEADAIWENFDGELEVIDAKSLHPNWNSYRYSYPKYHNCCQLMSYFKALKKRNTPTDKALVRGRIWYTGRGDKTTSLECPVEWTDWETIVEEEIATYTMAKRTPASELPTLPKHIKKTGGSTRLSAIDYAPQWHCEYCDFQGISCIPHDMKSNALLYKVGKEWKVSKLGRQMTKEVLEVTGINLDNLDVLDTGWVGPTEDAQEV